jgi:CysZ protein
MAEPRRPRFFREVLAGMLHLGTGMRLWVTRPRLMLFGAIPAVIVAIVLTASLVALGFSVQGVATWGTPFADDWDPVWRTPFRGLLAGALFLGGLVFSITAFTAITLMVGAPFYDRIRLEVDRMHGEPEEPEPTGLGREILRGIADGIRTLLPAMFFGIAMIPLGFIPIVGQLLVVVLSALFGGWFVTVELTGSAADVRGISLRDRRRMLRARMPRTLGLGVSTYLLFLVPLGPVFAMPAAVAGATLMVRTMRDEPSSATPKAQGPPATPPSAPTPAITPETAATPALNGQSLPPKA